MKNFLLLFCFLIFISGNSFEVKAFSAKIVSGEMIFGGSGYGSPDYQTYTRFLLNVKRQNPQRNFRIDATQVYSVFLNHPIQPNGDFQYNVVMPYGPQSLSINGVSVYPIFLEDCKWMIRSSAITPTATPDSPQFVTVTSPFTITGLTALNGADVSNFKITGSGTVNIIFEKARPEEYYFREARYVFSENSQLKNDTK